MMNSARLCGIRRVSRSAKTEALKRLGKTHPSWGGSQGRDRDNELVTRHICEQLGLPISGILTGAEMQVWMTPLSACVESVNLFAGSTLRKKPVILALKQRGRVVGYMGDGINDAPSLHSADIGISVDSAVT